VRDGEQNIYAGTDMEDLFLMFHDALYIKNR